MQERPDPDSDLTDKPFDPEMTEEDESNAPDDTGPTAGSVGGDGPEEIGV